MIASAWLAAHSLQELAAAAVLVLLVAVALIVSFGWTWKRTAPPVRPTHPSARAAALREARSPGRPLDDGEAEVLARIEAGIAADAEWERLYAAITADWRVAR